MWLLDPNFDWNDQLAREYLKFRGQYYDVGTKVKIKLGGGTNKVVETVFLGWSYNGSGGGKSFECEFPYSKNYDYSTTELYIVEIIHPIYPKLEIITEKTVNRNCPDSWDIEIGWVWYILIMVVGAIFKDRVMIWFFASAVFFLWKNGFLNGGK